MADPVTQSVSQTTIPAYAQPYVESMLGQTAALTDINQNPYTAYDAQRIANFTPEQTEAFNRTANQQVAGQVGEASNLASAAGAGQLSTVGQAGQYGNIGNTYGNMAASMAPQAQQYGATGAQIGTQGGLGYGAQGAGYGAQGVGIGQQASNLAGSSQGLGALGVQQGLSYGQNDQNPNAVQSYMNPYLQASLNPQLQMMDRQNAQTQQKNQAQAVASGAFGGNRGALVQSQNQFYNDLAKQNLVGNAYNQAYNTANTNMQQAASLGMQGAQVGLGGQNAANAAYQTGLQGTAQGMQGSQIGLSGVNTALQGQQLGLSGLQQAGNLYGQGMTGAQIGLQGVGAQQAGYANANQAASTLGALGQTQFGQEQAITAGQSQAGAVQQAQQQQGLDVAYQDYLKQKNYPYQQLAFQSDMLRGVPLSQSAQSVYAAPPNAASQAGGLGMTALGVYGMANKAAQGGLMAAKAYKEGGQVGYSVGGSIENMNVKQLTELLSNPNTTPREAEMIEERIMLLNRIASNPESEQIMAPATQKAGIASIGTGDMVPDEVPAGAGGGIVAFAQGKLVRPEKEMDYSDLIRERLAKMDEGNPFTKSDEQAQSIRESMESRKKTAPWEALAMAGLGTMAGTSPYALTNLGLGGIEGLKSYGKSQTENAADQKLLLQQQVESEKSKYARDTGNLNAMMTAQGHKDTKEIGLLNAKNTAGANATAKQTAALIQAQNAYNQALDNAKDTLLKQTRFSSLYRNDPAAFNRAAKAEATAGMSPAVLEILGMKPTAAAPAPATTPAAKTSFPIPPAAAISALKSSKDQAKASQQFDDVFGPGAAQKALGK